MISETNSRLAGAVAVSIVAHIVLLGGVLTWLARPPDFRAAPDSAPALEIRLVPPPARAAPAVAPTRTRIVRRPTVRPNSDHEADAAIAEVGEPDEIATGPTAGAGGDGVTPEMVRQALRGGLVGCANADRVGLNRAERTRCHDIMGRNMAAMRRAMRAAEQQRLSTGGRPPREFTAFQEACRADRQRSGADPRPGGAAC